jgi:hypothetical protein
VKSPDDNSCAVVSDIAFKVNYLYSSKPEQDSLIFNSTLSRTSVKVSILVRDEASDGFLMVVGQGPDVLLSMWAAYSGLHQPHKSVDLIMLNSDEHVLTNPAVRLASQGGSVDWFRFWLQGYEDRDPAKVGQYKRRREFVLVFHQRLVKKLQNRTLHD